MSLQRQKEFQRNPHLECLLSELNGLLVLSEDQVIGGFQQPNYPVVFLMGCARSGTTLALQWLASTGLFSYPSNLISRFYAAPYIGARIQQMLTDSRFDFANEFGLSVDTGSQAFSSNLGKTHGLLSPNEFWYFWRRFFPDGETQEFQASQLIDVDSDSLVAEIAALESVCDRPVTMKGMFLNWNIPFLAGLFDKALFVQIRRHPFYNMQSLLMARQRFYGSEEQWYSFKPPEFSELRNRPVAEQIAGQLYYTNRAIETGMAQLSPERCLTLDYEMLCQQPADSFNQLAAKLAAQDFVVSENYGGPEKFKAQGSVRLPETQTRELMDAYRDLSKESLTTV